MAAQESGWLAGQIVEHAPDAIIMADRDGIIRLWNAAASTVFGYSAAEAVGQSLDLIVPEQFRARHWDGFGQVMETGVTPVCHGAARRAGHQERPDADLGGIQRHAAS